MTVHLAFESAAPDQVVHPVDAFKHYALAASRGTDETGDFVLADGDRTLVSPFGLKLSKNVGITVNA